VFLHCDLISRRTTDVPSDVLYSFSTLGLEVSNPFEKEPYRLEWHPVNTSMINSIRIWVTGGSSYRVGGSGAVLFKLRQNRTNSITTPI